MKIKGSRKNVITLMIVTAIVFAATGCSDKLYSDPAMTVTSVQETVDPMSFAVIDAKIRDYNFGINEYMREHSSEATVNKISGKTVNGISAECTYTISPDGKYESLQMEKTLNNGVQMDEYFNMGDAIFIARTTVYNDGNFEPVEKFYIIDDGLYKVDGSAETVTKISDISDSSAQDIRSSNDLYLSFDEIRAIYA